MQETLPQHSRPPQPRPWIGAWNIAVGWTLLALIGLVWAMVHLPIDRTPVAQAGVENLHHLWLFWIASAAIWVGLTGLWMILKKGQRAPAPAPAPGSGDVRQFRVRDAVVVFLVALGVRVALLIVHKPSISDDVYRYIYDGRNLAAGFNPYLVLPVDGLKRDREHWPGERQLAGLVTYPELATPYLPVSQCVFAGLGLIVGDRWTDPASSARVFRIGFTALELVMIGVMFIALKRAQRSAWWAALYAWHPLAISEIAGSGHQDVIGMACLVAALTVFSIAPAKTWRWSMLLALSALGKPFTLPTGLIMLRQRPRRKWATSIAVGIIVAVLAFAPFWLIWGDHDRAFHQWGNTASVLAEKFAHFGGVYQPTLWMVQAIMPADGHPAGFNLTQEWLARKLCAGIVVMVVIGVYFSRLNVWAATRAMLFALVLLSTTAHPWYLLWGLALVPMSNSWAMWTLSLTLPWGYAVLGDVEHWTVSPWVYAAAYGPVLIAVVCDMLVHFSEEAKTQALPQVSSQQ